MNLPLPDSRGQLRLLSLPGDEDLIITGMTDLERMQYYGVWYPDPGSVQKQFDWYRQNRLEGKGEYWVIENAAGQSAGVLGMYDIQPEHRKAETGIWLLKAFEGQGLGTAAVMAITRYAFHFLNLHRLEAKVELENAACRALFRKAGWEVEGIQRECEWKNGRWVSLECLGKLATD